VLFSCNLGTLTSWNPLGHFRPVTGLLYLYPKDTLAVCLRFLRLRVSTHKVNNRIIINIFWKMLEVTLEYCCTCIDGGWRRKVAEPTIRFQRSVMLYAFHRRHHWIRLSYGRILPVVLTDFYRAKWATVHTDFLCVYEEPSWNVRL
jgi:hypothetical protein